MRLKNKPGANIMGFISLCPQQKADRVETVYMRRDLGDSLQRVGPFKHSSFRGLHPLETALRIIPKEEAPKKPILRRPRVTPEGGWFNFLLASLPDHPQRFYGGERGHTTLRNTRRRPPCYGGTKACNRGNMRNIAGCRQPLTRESTAPQCQRRPH